MGNVTGFTLKGSEADPFEVKSVKILAVRIAYKKTSYVTGQTQGLHMFPQ